MGSLFYKSKKKNDKTRKIPWLPRIGLYVDIGGYELMFKKVPAMETLLNVLERGMTYAQLKRVEREQFSEISFPKVKKSKVYQTTARTISVKSSNLP